MPTNNISKNLTKKNFELGLPLDFAYIPSVESTVSYVATEMGFTFDKVEEITTAVCESCKQFVKHKSQINSFQNETLKVCLSVNDHCLDVDFMCNLDLDDQEQLLNYTTEAELYSKLVDDFEYNIDHSKLHIKMSKLLYT